MSTTEIPFLDLVTVHREFREALCLVFETSLDMAARGAVLLRDRN